MSGGEALPCTTAAGTVPLALGNEPTTGAFVMPSATSGKMLSDVIVTGQFGRYGCGAFIPRPSIA